MKCASNSRRRARNKRRKPPNRRQTPTSLSLPIPDLKRSPWSPFSILYLEPSHLSYRLSRISCLHTIMFVLHAISGGVALLSPCHTYGNTRRWLYRHARNACEECCIASQGYIISYKACMTQDYASTPLMKSVTSSTNSAGFSLCTQCPVSSVSSLIFGKKPCVTGRFL